MPFVLIILACAAIGAVAFFSLGWSIPIGLAVGAGVGFVLVLILGGLGIVG